MILNIILIEINKQKDFQLLEGSNTEKPGESYECEFKDLINISEKKKSKSVPEENLWAYKISNCKLSINRRKEKALLEFDADITDHKKQESQFKFEASGKFYDGIGHLKYSFIDRDRKSRKWDGVMMLKKSSVDSFYGIWMATGIMDHGKTSIGSIKLQRK